MAIHEQGTGWPCKESDDFVPCTESRISRNPMQMHRAYANWSWLMLSDAHGPHCRGLQ